MRRLNDRGQHVSAQIIASYALRGKAQRSKLVAEHDTAQDRALDKALEEFEEARDFIDPLTNGPRGPQNTQHGEIAESVHVAILRAKDLVEGREPNTTFGGSGRKGPIDFWDGDTPVQMKYAHSTSSSLNHIRDHIDQFGANIDGDDFEFVIPRDQHEQIIELRDTGTIQGLSRTKVGNIRSKLEQIEGELGRDPMEAIHRGELTYQESHRDHVHDALEQREIDIKDRSSDIKERILDDHGPSLEGLGQTAALGGVAGAGVGIVHALIDKSRNGRNLFSGDFTAADWDDVCRAAGKGIFGGAVSGSALYGLTNLTDLAAPFAGSLVSAVLGIRELRRSCRSGEIDADQFAEASCLVACDAAIVGIAAFAGQTVIPIPLLGAFLGSISGKIVASVIKKGLMSSTDEMIRRLDSFGQRAIERLDDECRAVMKKLDGYFGEFDRICKAAFDPDTNTALRLRKSVELARKMKVSEDLILDSTDDLDRFMTG